MRDTPEDLARVDRLLEASYAAAGSHLLSVITPERRLNAAQLSARLTGMCLLSLATTTSAGEPRVGPVDGIYYRGDFWFGSSPDSLRFRHIAARPAVSATHVPGEHLSVTVHGQARRVNLHDPGQAEFSELCVEIYGDSWKDWGAGAAYARIDAERMFTFFLEKGSG